MFSGADWDNMIWPMTDKVSILLAPLFSLYIAFVFLAMMNVVTGIFVDKALINASKEKDRNFVNAFRQFFAKDVDEEGQLSRARFEAGVSQVKMHKQLQNVGINPVVAPFCFYLLDKENVGKLDLEDLMSGLLHLRANASTMDIALVLE